MSKCLHTPKASHLFTITQHITVNGLAETSYDVLCCSHTEHTPLPMHLQPPGRAHDIQVTLTRQHCKWTTINTFMIAAQWPCVRARWMIRHQNSFWWQIRSNSFNAAGLTALIDGWQHKWRKTKYEYHIMSSQCQLPNPITTINIVNVCFCKPQICLICTFHMSHRHYYSTYLTDMLKLYIFYV